MPDEMATAEAPPRMSSPSSTVHPPLRLHTRLRHGVRRPHNWVQLFKFCVVGGSGYVVNLSVFAVAYKALGVHHIAAATIAFAVALFNNFWWNRHWTFGAHGAREHHAGFQAARFFAVSIAAFLVALGILQLLVDNTSIPTVVSQAISIVAATPLNFVGNKMWTFRRIDAGPA
ncbi:MAG: GtrA family protein [Actinobacteria bacterium]|nr:GtrA family protein [Actinomycetota bacterium]